MLGFLLVKYIFTLTGLLQPEVLFFFSLKNQPCARKACDFETIHNKLFEMPWDSERRFVPCSCCCLLGLSPCQGCLTYTQAIVLPAVKLQEAAIFSEATTTCRSPRAFHPVWQRLHYLAVAAKSPVGMQQLGETRNLRAVCLYLPGDAHS